MAVSKFWLDVFGKTVSVEGGLVALQSPLLTIKRGTSPFNFQLNELFLKFLWQQMAISKFLSDGFQGNTWCIGGRGLIHPPIALNLKKGTRTSDYQSSEPPPKFIQSPFLYIPYMPPRHISQPLPWVLGGVILKDIISGAFNYVEQYGYLKILFGCFWTNGGLGRGVPIERSFYDNSFDTKCPGLKEKKLK